MLGHGFSQNIIEPQGTGANGVLILGEAPGQQEDDCLYPFCEYAPAGAVLERAIRRLGMRRESFVITNTVPSRPPNNFLEGAPWEAEAISWGQPFLQEAIEKFRPRAILALGNVATRATTGLAGNKLGVSHLTGFVLPSPRYGIPVIPCFHPSYLRRGAMAYFGVLMRAIRLATKVASEGRQPQLPPVENPPPGYILYPTEEIALAYELTTVDARYIAYDIETPYSTDEDSAEEAEGVQSIKSVQFSINAGTGIFLPWREPFIPIAKRILGNGRPKLGWNIWRFDDPILAANQAPVLGERHDLMWGWHHTQPDISRALQFAAAQQGWPWPWKHLDAANPQFYGIVDVDVLQWMVS